MILTSKIGICHCQVGLSEGSYLQFGTHTESVWHTESHGPLRKRTSWASEHTHIKSADATLPQSKGADLVQSTKNSLTIPHEKSSAFRSSQLQFSISPEMIPSTQSLKSSYHII